MTAAIPSLTQRLHEHARASPKRWALRAADEELTYLALAQRTSVAASALRSAGVGEGDRVGLLLGGSAAFVIAMAACLEVGAIFVPLPLTDPDARLRQIIEDCRPVVVIACEQDRARAARAGARVLTPTALRDPSAAGQAPALDADPSRLSYIVYTSGTTGTPKGVAIRWASVANFIIHTVMTFDLSETTIALCTSPPHFDGSFGSLFGVLAAGGQLVFRGQQVPLPREYLRWVHEHRITHASGSPSYLRMLARADPEHWREAQTLRTFGMGGEDCSPEDLRRLRELHPQLRIFNRYGPTETTIVASSFEVTDASLRQARKIPLGMPHEGVEFVLADHTGRVLEGMGVTGELCIGGVQVMAGYWADTSQTERVMRRDLLPGKTLYATGDLVRRDEDGLYTYLGRMDEVVNRAGHRIALAEIGKALRDVEGVQDAVVTAIEDDRRVIITAHLVLERMRSEIELRKALLQRLPPQMSPDRMVVLDALPLTSAGKVDVASLRRMRHG
jgi:D-alanine--poly(phosphoribitol) ligase subunit 1